MEEDYVDSDFDIDENENEPVEVEADEEDEEKRRLRALKRRGVITKAYKVEEILFKLELVCNF